MNDTLTDNQNDAKNPIATLVDALINDPEYAWGWHCNIAMACHDKGAGPHAACNAGAALFLKILTGGKVDTTTHSAYQQTQINAPESYLMDRPWIGVDLDGTLAHYDEWRGIEHIGPPIEAMRQRVLQWLAEGQEVRILTARVGPQRHDVPHTIAEITGHIEDWCLTHLGQKLRVTSQKDYCMVEFWDDRCVQVVPNTGRSLAEEMEALKKETTWLIEANRSMQNGLYQAIVEKMKPCYPANTRDLEWDVLPQTIGKMANVILRSPALKEQEIADLTAKLAAAEKRLGEIAKLPEKWLAPGYFGTRRMLSDELISALASPPDPSAEEAERAEFEKDCARFDFSFTRDWSGNYGDSRTLMMFDVWKLARASKEVKAAAE